VGCSKSHNPRHVIGIALLFLFYCTERRLAVTICVYKTVAMINGTEFFPPSVLDESTIIKKYASFIM
jgi:hypothetical protein